MTNLRSAFDALWKEQGSAFANAELYWSWFKAGAEAQKSAHEPGDKLEALQKERYRLRSALGAIIGLFHDQEHEAKNIARRVLDSTAENR